METLIQNYKYVEWKSTKEMHYSSLQWISEMMFIKEEHHFIENMLKEYTLPIIKSNLLSKVKVLITRLTKLKQKTDTLFNKITDHRNGLRVMIYGICQLKEENNYKKEHRKLLIDMNLFSKEYNILKKEIFGTVSTATVQQKRVLN